MKISKALGFGLFLHLVLVVALVVQPGCRTPQPPTQTYQQTMGQDSLSSNSTGRLIIPSSRIDPVLDPAFNAGTETHSSERFEPTRPDLEFSEFEEITPRLSPIVSEPTSSTVEIAGPSFKIHTIQKGDSLWAISKRYSVSLDELYEANGLNKSSVLKIGQQIQIPVEGSTAKIRTITADTYQPSGFNMGTETYTVVKGDTLSKIARRFSTTVSLIRAANNKSSDVIRVGEKLTIPVGDGASSSKPAAVAPSSNRNTFSSSTLANASSANASGVHVVRAGEYPATIARRYGMTTSELLAINGITDPRKMQVGQKLKVNPKSNPSTLEPKSQPATTTMEKAPIVIKPETVAISSNSSSSAPVEIRVVEADPLIESEIDEINTDALFENAVEIPVVPLDDE